MSKAWTQHKWLNNVTAHSLTLGGVRPERNSSLRAGWYVLRHVNATMLAWCMDAIRHTRNNTYRCRRKSSSVETCTEKHDQRCRSARLSLLPDCDRPLDRRGHASGCTDAAVSVPSISSLSQLLTRSATSKSPRMSRWIRISSSR